MTKKQAGSVMTKQTVAKKATRRMKKAAPKKATKTLTTTQAAKTDSDRDVKVYRLRAGVPKTMRKGTAARAVLESIGKHRKATARQIRKDMKRGFPDATLRFYLGKFQRDKVVVAT